MHVKVVEMAEKAGVKLEIYESAKSRLNIASLFASTVPDTVALCAGDNLASAVSKAYLQAGGSLEQVRKEHFNWR